MLLSYNDASSWETSGGGGYYHKNWARSKQLSTVVIPGFQFGFYRVVIPLSFLFSDQPCFIVSFRAAPTYIAHIRECSSEETAFLKTRMECAFS